MNDRPVSFFFLRSKIFPFFFLLSLSILLAACGGRSGFFKLEGRFTNMNQGEFYVYSEDGITDGIDTIKVNGGRFAYEVPCNRAAVLMLVFPNFSEQPIFAEPGKSVTIKGDASHMKEMEVKGTDDNELMTDFRLQIANASPPEAVRMAETFIRNHADSPVSAFLVRRYFVLGDKSDVTKAKTLIDLMLKEQEKNGMLMRMKQQVDTLSMTAVGSRLPAFAVTDVKGEAVTQDDLSTGVAVINVWASWRYETKDMQRQLKQLSRQSGGRLHLLGISIDASRHDCENAMKQDTITWHNICDEQLFDGKLVRQLGITSVPYNLVMKDGRIVARGLSKTDLKKKVEELLQE